jgi:PspA associated protein B
MAPRRADGDLSALVTDLHAINTTLVDAGHGAGLLCTVIGFAGTVDGKPRSQGLICVFKRGAYYPFTPTTDRRRDTTLEMRVQAGIAGEPSMPTTMRYVDVIAKFDSRLPTPDSRLPTPGDGEGRWSLSAKAGRRRTCHGSALPGHEAYLPITAVSRTAGPGPGSMGFRPSGPGPGR